jgi:hypothetical protein
MVHRCYHLFHYPRDLDQLHFIAHSRGAVVASEVIQRLGWFQQQGQLSVSVDENIHFTTLDPHPWDNETGDNIGEPLSANDNDVNNGIYELSPEYPGDAVIGRGVVKWQNIKYNDNYWQDDGYTVYLLNKLTGLFLELNLNGLSEYPNIGFSFPLADRLTPQDINNPFSDYNFRGSPSFSHGAVHAWYYGTINTDCHSCGDDLTCHDGGGIEFESCEWYGEIDDNDYGYAIDREEFGFGRSRNFENPNIVEFDNELGFALLPDNNMDIYKIFNGDFSKWNVLGSAPGWAHQGGGGSGKIALSLLHLGMLDSHRSHNKLYIPTDATHLRFRRAVLNKEWGSESNVDKLVVKINDNQIGIWPLNEYMWWTWEKLDISDYAGEICDLSFSIVDYYGNGIGSEVWIDNVEFMINDKIGNDYMLVDKASPVDLVITAPNGDFINKTESNIAWATYDEYEIIPGDTGATITIPNPQDGIYHIDVIPSSHALDTDVYSLFVSIGDEVIVLADSQIISSIPINGYAYSSLDTGSISGLILNESDGLIGVPVDLYDSDGEILLSTVIDENGAYLFPGLDNGDYSVSISTPLGYLTDEETKQIQVRGLPHEVKFEITQLESTPSQRSRGYWAHQLHKALQNKPKQYTLDDFAGYTTLIDQHFNQNDLNPVDFYAVPQPASQNDSLMILKKLLHMRNTGDDWEPMLKRLAKAQLMALMLNVVSGKVHQTYEITEDGRTVSQLITYCDMLVNDEIDPPDNNGCPGHGSQWFRYIYASYMLVKANLGLTVPAGMISEDVINIAYKVHADVQVPDGFELGDCSPNPFNPETNISYSIPEACQVKLEIYNIIGQRVATLVDAYQDAGNYTVTWNSRNSNGVQVSSGAYLYRIVAGDYVESKKMILLK